MKKLNVQLIILEFGGNATAYMTDEKAIASYKNKKQEPKNKKKR